MAALPNGSRCLGCLTATGEASTRVLPCLHTLCVHCVDGAGGRTGRCRAILQDGVVCDAPFLPSACLAPSGTLPPPPPTEDDNGAAGATLCGFCKRRAATHACTACGHAYCAVHSEDHVDLLGHAVVAFTPTTTDAGDGAESSEDECETHPGQPLDLFCQQCDSLACRACCAGPNGAHHGHAGVVAASEAGAQQNLRLRRYVASAQPLLQAAGHLLAQTRQALGELKHNEAATLASIEAKFDGYIAPLQRVLDALVQRKRSLKDDVASGAAKHAHKLEEQRDVATRTLDGISLAQQMAGSIVIEPPSVHTFKLRKMLLLRLSALEAAQLGRASQTNYAFALPSPPSTTFASLASMDPKALGELSCRSVELSSFGAARDYKSIGSSRPVRILGEPGNRPNQLMQPRSVVFDRATGHLVVGDNGNKRIQVLSATTGQHVRSIFCTTNGVQGVSVVPDTALVWAASMDDNLLTLYSMDTALVLRSIAVQRPYGVAALADGGVAVACDSTSRIELYSAQGTKRWSSNGAGLRGVARGVVVIEDSRLVGCTDYENGRVQLLSLDTGTFVRSIASTGTRTGGGLLHRPISIAYDRAAQVVLVGEETSQSVSAWPFQQPAAGNGHQQQLLIHRWAKETVGTAGPTGIDVHEGSIVVCDGSGSRLLMY